MWFRFVIFCLSAICLWLTPTVRVDPSTASEGFLVFNIVIFAGSGLVCLCDATWWLQKKHASSDKKKDAGYSRYTAWNVQYRLGIGIAIPVCKWSPELFNAHYMLSLRHEIEKAILEIQSISWKDGEARNHQRVERLAQLRDFLNDNQLDADFDMFNVFLYLEDTYMSGMFNLEQPCEPEEMALATVGWLQSRW